jgi:gas vesicle protein
MTSNAYDSADSMGSGTAFLTGLVAGVVIGSGLGLLFAPRKGSELRDQVADSAASVGKAVSRTVDELADRGREVYARARDVVSRAGDELAHAGGEMDRMAADAANKVDKGLAVAADVAATATKPRRVEPHVASRS